MNCKQFRNTPETKQRKIVAGYQLSQTGKADDRQQLTSMQQQNVKKNLIKVSKA
jgi:hypothetical protein